MLLVLCDLICIVEGVVAGSPLATALDCCVQVSMTLCIGLATICTRIGSNSCLHAHPQARKPMPTPCALLDLNTPAAAHSRSPMQACKQAPSSLFPSMPITPLP